VAGSRSLELAGLHCHIGSQIFETAPYCEAARVMARLMKTVETQFGVKTPVLDLGGGFGVRYTPANDPADAGSFLADISHALEDECRQLGIPLPHVAVEPGRAIVASAGVTLYTVGAIKEIPGVRTYVAVDGGMPDNPRYALYGSEYTALVANRADRAPSRQVTIAGRCCESGDLIQEHTWIQEPETGDILAVLATGAYNYSMASNYNRVPRPAMVMVKDGNPRIIINRESYEDLIRNDI